MVSVINQRDMVLQTLSAKRPSPNSSCDGFNWAIVLAGGSGERMRKAIGEWFGAYKPKQFCAFSGSLSMLEHTWYRARKIVGDRIVTVAIAEHESYFRQLPHDVPGTLLYQPDKVGTAGAVYLALAYILSIDRNANVILMPSDHFICPEYRFTTLAKHAFTFARLLPQKMILMAAEARGPNTDYGWIKLPAHEREAQVSYLDATLHPIEGFVEKPQLPVAKELYEKNGLWSTMILCARGSLMWELARELQPEFHGCLEDLRSLTHQYLSPLVNQKSIDDALVQCLLNLPVLDYSRDILQRCPQHCLVLPMTGINWDDWGRPERILQCIEHYHLPSSLHSHSGH